MNAVSLRELRVWTAAYDDAYSDQLSTRWTNVTTAVEKDGNGVWRSWWLVRRGRFTARLPLEACICRENSGRPLHVCTKIGPLPRSCYGARHCHAWHPERAAAYVALLDRNPTRPALHLPKTHYHPSAWVDLEAS